MLQFGHRKMSLEYLLEKAKRDLQKERDPELRENYRRAIKSVKRILKDRKKLSKRYFEKEVVK